MTITRIADALQRLRDNERGIAMTEFALVAPILIMLGTAALEMSNYAVVRMRVSQITMNVADNISRVGVETGMVFQVGENDVNDTFAGAAISGGNLGLYDNGRVVISSLETNPDGGQWIHWQRCKGAKRVLPQYGVEGDGRTGTGLVGMGPASARVTSPSTSVGVMFVEVTYDYQPLFPFLWQPVDDDGRLGGTGSNTGGGSSDEQVSDGRQISAIFSAQLRTIRYGNAFMVRDNRDYNHDTARNGGKGIFDPDDPLTGRKADKALCSKYTT